MVTMTKQDALREGIDALIADLLTDWEIGDFEGDSPSRALSRTYVEKFLQYLHDNDVVRKVKRKLPKYHSSARVFLHEAYPIVQKELIDAGYTATEPLI